MRLLQDGVVAALAAIGLTAVIFLLVSAIVHPRRRGTLPAPSSWTAALPTSRAAWRSSCAAANTRSTSAKEKN